MNLIQWDPFRELDEMHERITNLFNRSLGSGQVMALPPTDIYEEGDRLVIETTLPKFKEEEVDVSINQGRLEIKAEKSSDSEEKDRNYLRRETQSASYYRQFTLPSDIEEESAEASFENGQLRVSFQRKQLPQPKKLQLKSGSKTKKE